jgi:hypothetical protein
VPENPRNTSDLQNPLVDVARALSDVARSLEAEPDLHHTVSANRMDCRTGPC